MSDAIMAEVYQCPVCVERDYILVTTEDEEVIQIICLSCGYDGSNSEDFVIL